jgi:hypothetical protein
VAELTRLERFVANATDGVREGYIASWSLTQSHEGFTVSLVLADRQLTIVSPDLNITIDRVGEKMVEVLMEPERGQVLQ